MRFCFRVMEQISENGLKNHRTRATRFARHAYQSTSVSGLSIINSLQFLLISTGFCWAFHRNVTIDLVKLSSRSWYQHFLTIYTRNGQGTDRLCIFPDDRDAAILRVEAIYLQHAEHEESTIHFRIFSEVLPFHSTNC